jgi:membrane-associated phospholipid phosphatase
MRYRSCVAAALTALAILAPVPARAQDAQPAATTPDHNRFAQFLKDVAGDYAYIASWETVKWYAAGAASAGLMHLADESLRQATEDPDAAVTQAFEAGGTGATYGNLGIQLPIAIGWWAIGQAASDQRAVRAGRDLARAQINTLTWTYALKYAVDRTRPNGDPRSFPSGHASATFATAMVLQQHYGWKVGGPVFVLAGMTGASRITVNKHWASDVVFGAFVGMASGRTATRAERRHGVVVNPFVVPGGGGVMVIRSR